MEKQILKNQATIMTALFDILNYLKVEDMTSAIAIRDRMEETKDILKNK